MHKIPAPVIHTPALPEPPAGSSDITRLLSQAGFAYTLSHPYLKVGTPAQVQGWIIHVSCVAYQYVALVAALLPLLQSFNMPFRLIINRREADRHNNSHYGHDKVGKIITIYMEERMDAQAFIPALLSATEGFLGPEVSTDTRVSGVVYYRYGAFLPLLHTDGYGERCRLMYNFEGQLIQDTYRNPDFVHNWSFNPFIPFTRHLVPSAATAAFFKKFKAHTRIQSSPKGDVFKGIYPRWGFLPTWCIFKQGRMGIFAVSNGTDIRDRLRWQFHILQQLQGQVRAPRMIAEHSDAERAHIVMSVIHGSSFYDCCTNVLQHRLWCHLLPKEQNHILELVQQVVRQVQVLHRNGYVHRDITATNFMVSPAGKVYLIDLEMAYHLPTRTPTPHFDGGTPGYMSPQQRVTNEVPSFADDSYALGCLLLFALTGLEPALLLEEELERVQYKVSFLVRNDALTSLLLACLSPHPESRPTTQHILHQLQQLSGHVPPSQKAGPDSPLRYLSHTIQGSIHALCQPPLLTDGHWQAFTNQYFDPEVHPHHKKAGYTNLYKGVAGPLFVLLEARQAGMDVAACLPHMHLALELVQQNVLNNIDNVSPGLYYGSAGIALLLAKAIRHQFIPATDAHLSAIFQCLQKDNDDVNILHGAAGEGIALLQCKAWLPGQGYDALLHLRAQKLMERQLPDGSWLTRDPEDKPEKNNSFGYGIAGMVYFLLRYGQACNHAQAFTAAHKGLHYLQRQATIQKNTATWPVSNRHKKPAIWWCNGTPGIAQTFLKAYEITSDPAHLRLAEQALRSMPACTTAPFLHQCHGLSSLGELYLQAARSSASDEWRHRAAWVAELLITLRSHSPQGGFHWTMDNSYKAPTAELMLGHSGILRFLLRFQHPETLNFLILE